MTAEYSTLSAMLVMLRLAEPFDSALGDIRCGISRLIFPSLSL